MPNSSFQAEFRTLLKHDIDSVKHESTTVCWTETRLYKCVAMEETIARCFSEHVFLQSHSSHIHAL